MIIGIGIFFSFEYKNYLERRKFNDNNPINV